MWYSQSLLLLAIIEEVLSWTESSQGFACVRVQDQLYCPSAGDLLPRINLSEPISGGERYRGKRIKRENIDSFLDDNKSLIRRMFGDVTGPEEPRDFYESYDGKAIHTRTTRSTGSTLGGSLNKVDACESTVEIVTPYWASNSAGKIRAIVNTQHLQQAIQQEVCQNVQTRRCNSDCSCEQKYKWHRLLAYDPDDDCKGIFMDWFLFPSCCVCRCLTAIKTSATIKHG